MGRPPRGTWSFATLSWVASALWLAVYPALATTPSRPAAFPLVPAAPVEESGGEDQKPSEVSRALAEWQVPSRGFRRATNATTDGPVLLAISLSPIGARHFRFGPAPSDPFRNGLGAHYRC